jgi:hypothetical protein
MCLNVIRAGSSHRTNVIPTSLRNSSMRSSIVVNWENTIVFSPWSSPSSFLRNLISLSSSRILRILAESGGKFESLTRDRDLRDAFRASSMQSLQCSPSLAMFSGVNLQQHDVSHHMKRETARLHTRPDRAGTFCLWKPQAVGTSS